MIISNIKFNNQYTLRNPLNIFIHLVLIIVFIFRLLQLEYPGINSSKWGDGYRDYLAGHYILKYHENPLVGPFNLLNASGIKNSPLYYYLIALFLSFKDSIWTLSMINLLFYIVSIYLVFLISKISFDKYTAILTLLFFIFSPKIALETEFIWQPFVMQPFAYFSLFLFIYAFLSNSFKHLYLSLFTLIFAFVLHNSAFAWIIIFMPLLIFKLRKDSKKSKKYLILSLVCIIPFLLFYFPVLIFYLQEGWVKSGLNNLDKHPLFIISWQNYFNNFFYNLSLSFEVFSLDFWNRSFIYKLYFMIILLGFLMTLFKKDKTFWFFCLFLSLFLMPILLSSLFNKNQVHYLTISLGMLAILIAKSLHSILEYIILLLKRVHILRPYWPILIICFILFILKIISNDFSVFFKKQNLEDPSHIFFAARAMKNKIIELEKINSLGKKDFFQIISYANNGTFFRYPTLDTILIVPLEEIFDIKLAKLSNNSPFSLVQTNRTDYIFINCFEFYNQSSVLNCTGSFLNEYKNYQIITKIHDIYPLSIYLAKRL